MIPFDVVILGTRHKKIITTDYMNGLTYHVYYNKDWPLPKFTRSKLARAIPNVRKYEPRPYRCFKGHQGALSLAKTDKMLVLEDDAVPNRPSWHQVVVDASELLDEYDVVNLHARGDITWAKTFKFKGRDYGIVGFTGRRDIDTKEPRKIKWALGSLAYLTTKKYADYIMSLPYEGVPMDLFLVNQTNNCILMNSCFDHDRKHGSIIQGQAGQCKPVQKAVNKPRRKQK